MSSIGCRRFIAGTTAKINDHYLYLSTPETSPVTVNLYDGSGATFGDSPYTISNGNPVAIEIGNGQTSGSKLMVSQGELNETLTNRGIKVEASAPHFLQCTVPVLLASRSAHIERCASPRPDVSLGRHAHHLPGGIRSYVFGIMATEDNVQVQISGYDNNVVFAGTPTVNDDFLAFTLNEGECRVYSAYANSEANLAGVLGALVQSNGNIVINVGNWCGSVGTTSSNQDIGADQIVRFNTSARTTSSWKALATRARNAVRGRPRSQHRGVPQRLGHTFSHSAAGEWYMSPNSEYTGAPHSNCFIQTSKPAYVYQFLGGSPSQSTVGMNFIPPISCGMPNEVDEIRAFKTSATPPTRVGYLPSPKPGPTSPSTAPRRPEPSSSTVSRVGNLPHLEPHRRHHRGVHGTGRRRPVRHQFRCGVVGLLFCVLTQ